MSVSDTQRLPLISVVVPVYKVEKYLRKCVDSIIGQTYGNLEIILVDDGSPDVCGAICDEYAKKDSRIRVIHKPNGGLSSARNAGIDIANGEWIGFVDSDDYCHPQMYEKLYDAAKRDGADMVVCGFTSVEETGKSILEDKRGIIDGGVLTGDEALRRLCDRGQIVWSTAYNRLYNAGLFKCVRFPEGRIHEDEFTAHHFYDRCKRVIALSDILYYYVRRDGSITTAPFSLKRLDAYYALLDRYEFFKSKGSAFDACAERTMQTMCGIVSTAVSRLDYAEHKAVLQPLYNEAMRACIGRLDLLRAVKLFIWRRKGNKW